MLRDGSVIAASHEERFTRCKNDDAFPVQAIASCLDEANLKPGELDGVAIASFHQDYFHQLTRPGRWSVADYVREQHDYWKPVLIERRAVRYDDAMADRVDRHQHPDWYWNDLTRNVETFPDDRRTIAARHLGLPADAVHTIEHHRAHAYYGYHAATFRGSRALAFTIDASGDGVNATIGTFNEQGRYERLFSTDQCFIARFYRYMTLHLGMKPNEHEYKLMGLAPYGKERHGQKALELFRSTLYVDGLDFKWRVRPTDSYFWFRERLEGERFDNVAWALQTWVEEMLCQWVGNALERFGPANVVVSGGVAMNIKAMGRLAQLHGVREFFVPGSAADESLAIGAGLCLDEDLTAARDENGEWLQRRPVPGLYLGPAYDAADEAAAIKLIDTARYHIFDTFNDDAVVDRLLAGDVIGRCCGRMEFGQRALGNRSLLADPTNPYVKDKINAMIKSRDFWMPFAPVVLDTFARAYLKAPKVDSPYMTIGYETTDEGFAAMRSACHPADRSARPQILSEAMNPQLYSLLQAFARRTGRGALLNTSFNIHGEPIVNSPAGAVEVLSRCALDALLLQRHFVVKQEADGISQL